MSQDITVEEWLDEKNKYVTMDVRSPFEFYESAIPHSINIPIFTNEERAEIGTLYKQVGANAAKWRAMEVVAPKIPHLMEKIKEVEESGKKPLIYCWRGGMRSGSVAQFATFSGLHVYRLKGGYRAYRKKSLEIMSELLPNKAVILHGMTGTGKTLILQNLKKLGYPVLDLEKMANHKGSLFGAIDGRKPHNQKTFDGLLFEELFSLQNSPFIIMEGESKRIGHSVQPDSLLALRDNALHIYVTASTEARIERIYAEYVQPNENSQAFKENVHSALLYVVKRMKSTEWKQAIFEALEENNYGKLVELLMRDYYDPQYLYKEDMYIRQSEQVVSDNIEEATNQVIEILNRHHLFRKTNLTSIKN
ncbi:MAG: tRNA 2-selenouridine(34) synthase MnmH [Heyndrickxia sp.]